MTSFTRSYRIAPSLICADLLNLESEIKRLVKAEVELIHFDVMDGVFVPRYGFFPEVLTALKKLTKIPVDVHMMTVEPEKYIPVFANAGADYFVVHAEACTHLHQTIMAIKKAGMKAGVALNPTTSLDVLDWVLEEIDIVCLMAINPGIVGHKLIPNMMQKIAYLKQKLGSRDHIIIEVDGGVAPDSVTTMVANGANALVCGTSSIFKPDKPVDEKIKEFRELIDKGSV